MDVVVVGLLLGEDVAVWLETVLAVVITDRGRVATGPCTVCWEVIDCNTSLISIGENGLVRFLIF